MKEKTLPNNGYPQAATESVIGKFLLLLGKTIKHGTEYLGGSKTFRIARGVLCHCRLLRKQASEAAAKRRQRDSQDRCKPFDHTRNI
tara:strand:+ start:6596 stop:6856 length:261 start_codon:yes stop_codon:yes gene_type:complete